MIKEKSWIEFQQSGMLWWINMILHTFGWAIVFAYDENNTLTCVYPARVKFRGFGEKFNTDGYIKVSQYMKDNAEELLAESQD